CLLSLSLFIAAPSFGDNPWQTLEQRVTRRHFANGITLLVMERHYAPTVSIRMMFPTGSVDETSGKTGLAHMFEHMLFKGTRTLGTNNYAEEAPLLKQIDNLYRQMDAEKNKRHLADQKVIADLIEKIRPLEEKASAFVNENELWQLYE